MKKILTVLLTLTFCWSCQMEDLFSKKPQKAIIGRWNLIASGETEHDMNERGGHALAFLSDGTFIFVTNGSRWGTYTIDKDFLYLKYDEDYMADACYKYKLSKDKLKLTVEPMQIRPVSPGEYRDLIMILNVFLYKKNK